MSIIEDLHICTAQDAKAQITYLEQTPVQGIAALLRDGTCSLRRGVVRSVADLGRLKTEFGNLGPLRPPARNGATKFLVSEVLPALEANPGADEAMRADIVAFVRKDERGEVEYNITVMYSDNEPIVKDGNKRTIAFYERRRTSPGSIEFPVFVVHMKGYAG